MRRNPLPLLLFALLPAAPAAADEGPELPAPEGVSPLDDAPLTGEVIVSFADRIEPSAATLRGLLHRDDIVHIEHLAGSWPVYRLVGRSGVDPLALAELLGARPDVEWAWADRLVEVIPTGEPLDDEYFGRLWHLSNDGSFTGHLPGADINALEAWDFALGEGAVIAVIDSGVDTTHPDLSVVPGVDIIDRDEDPHPGPDGNNHGTAVAGLAAAIGDNGIGVAGVAPRAAVMPFRALGGSVSMADMRDAFVLAADRGASVINNSWTILGNECTPIGDVPPLYNGIAYAVETGRGGLGTPVVYSAGNQGCESSHYQVLHQPGVISVGASSDSSVKLDYSSFGTHVWLSAPSGWLWSRSSTNLTTTDIVGGDGWNGLGENREYTGSMSGTSSSAPIVSGVVALMVSANPRLTQARIREVLCETAEKIDLESGSYGPDGWSPWYGCGRVDAGAAVAMVADLGAPSPVAVTHPEDGGALRVDAAVLTWAPSEDPDGATVTYEVELIDEAAGDDDDSAGGPLLIEVGEETRLDLSDHVVVGGSYRVVLRALDRWGASEPAELGFEVTAAPAPPVVDPEDEGEGCAVAGRSASAAGLLLLLLPAVRRRR